VRGAGRELLCSLQICFLYFLYWLFVVCWCAGLGVNSWVLRPCLPPPISRAPVRRGGGREGREGGGREGEGGRGREKGGGRKGEGWKEGGRDGGEGVGGKEGNREGGK
jgi:hypothetical protein